jgi:hypothetical protein
MDYPAISCHFRGQDPPDAPSPARFLFKANNRSIPEKDRRNRRISGDLEKENVLSMTFLDSGGKMNTNRSSTPRFPF